MFIKEKSKTDQSQAGITVQRLTMGEPYVFICGDYVLSPAKNAFNNKVSYWISKKGYTAAYYCFSVISMDYPRAYEKEIRSIMGCAAIAGMDLRSDLKRNDVAAGLERSMQSYISLFDRKTEG